MKRSIVTVLGAAGALALAPMAARAQTVWTGNMFVTAVPSPTNCINSSGVSVADVGDFYRALYRPAGTALGNGADSYLALVSQRSAFAITVPNNSFRAGINYASSYVSSTVGFGSNAAGITQWQQSPTSPGTGTANVTLTATLANFWNLTGCTVTLQGALPLTP